MIIKWSLITFFDEQCLHHVVLWSCKVRLQTSKLFKRRRMAACCVRDLHPGGAICCTARNQTCRQWSAWFFHWIPLCNTSQQVSTHRARPCLIIKSVFPSWASGYELLFKGQHVELRCWYQPLEAADTKVIIHLVSAFDSFLQLWDVIKLMWLIHVHRPFLFLFRSFTFTTGRRLPWKQDLWSICMAGRPR